MESDNADVPLETLKQTALWVGRRLHEEFFCQVQVVWSGNKSFHVHFRINRKDVVVPEGIAIQKFLTELFEKKVRKRFKLPTFSFDRRVANRLGLVRLGNGTRTEVAGEPVSVKQRVVRNWSSNFSDPANIFPMDEKLKTAISAPSISRARSRSREKKFLVTEKQELELRRYRLFLKRVGSTVRPSHWGMKDGSTPVLICYYGRRDKNPSCVLGLDSYFVTDSGGKKHPVVYSFSDYKETQQNDFRGESSEPKKKSGRNGKEAKPETSPPKNSGGSA